MDCIEHTQKGDKHGYGGAAYLGKVTTYHRKVYLAHHGLSHEEAVGMVVMHTCDNPRCINVHHLQLGSHKDNMRDMHEKGRSGRPVATAQPTKRKLTQEQAREIRASTESNPSLAVKYGVTRQIIINIRRNKTYREVG